MANSRTERIGTIFSRVTALLRGNALNPNNLPIWYDVYKAFPPKYEPRYDRVTSNKKIQDIFYYEDCIRAKFHEDVTLPAINLNSTDFSPTELFLMLYNDLLPINDNDKEKTYTEALNEYKKMFMQKELKPAKSTIEENNTDQIEH